MGIIIQIVLCIIAWNRGWKGRALIPLGIGIAFALIVGIATGASGGNANDLGWLVIFDVIVDIILLIMCFIPPKTKDVAEIEVLTETKSENNEIV